MSARDDSPEEAHHDVDYPPPAQLASSAHIPSRNAYDELYAQSLSDPEAFWGKIAEDFFWKKRWRKPFNRSGTCVSCALSMHAAIDTFQTVLLGSTFLRLIARLGDC